VRKDGTVIWGSLLATTIRDEEGEVVYFLAMIKDISDIKEAQEALQNQIEEYQWLNTQYKVQNKELRESLKQINQINRELEVAREKVRKFITIK